MAMIKPISKSAIHRICAGQVILDLSSAVKELVENSLDAGATSVEVSLRDQGRESFQVSDNGSGVSPANFKVLALKHHTSKLTDFPDLRSLTTFGFRGEALSSLAALGDLTVETRTKDEQVATLLSYDRSGVLVAEKKTARQVGTTVAVKNLFSNLPVRSKEFSRNIRKEYGKLITLLNAYALIAKGVRFVCTNTTGKNAKSVVFKTQGSGSLKDNIVTLFGLNTFNCLEPLELDMSAGCKVEGFVSKAGQGCGRNMRDRQFLFVNGRPVDMPKVTKLVNEMYKSANSLQNPIVILNFTIPTIECDVNVTPDKRKVFFSDEGSLLHILREGLENIYSSSDVRYAVNDLGNPDKASQLEQHRSALSLKRSYANESDTMECHDEEGIPMGDTPVESAVEKREDADDLEEFICTDRMTDFTLRVHGTKKVDESKKLRSSVDSVTASRIPLSSPTLAEKGISVNRYSYSSSKSSVQLLLDKFVNVNKRKHENTGAVLSEMPVLRNQPHHIQYKHISSGMNTTYSRTVVKSPQRGETEPSKCLKIDNIFSKITNPLSNEDNSDGEGSKEDFDAEDNRRSPLSNEKSNASLGDDVPFQAQNHTSVQVLDVPKHSSDNEMCATVHFSLQDLEKRRQQRLTQLQSSNDSCQSMRSKRCYAAATLGLSQPVSDDKKASDLAAATTELERFFRKEDFGMMKVIGQFNLGFIIGKLDQDLFIVDQHAADEKYNYERLAQSTILNQQPLLRPLRLDLSPEEEVVASMHIDIIRKNGFSLAEDADAPPGGHFILKAVPFSKNITFGVEDVKDLISSLADSHGDCSVLGSYRMDTVDSVCPSRVRAMFASRACRSSIMIGDALGIKEMQKILVHLAGLKSPWNCPHGRPTMRHLVDLTTLLSKHTDDRSFIM